MNLDKLMERLRIQSIIQRLVRTHGREAALEVILQAIALEFPDTKPAKTHRETIKVVNMVDESTKTLDHR